VELLATALFRAEAGLTLDRAPAHEELDRLESMVAATAPGENTAEASFLKLIPYLRGALLALDGDNKADACAALREFFGTIGIGSRELSMAGAMAVLDGGMAVAVQRLPQAPDQALTAFARGELSVVINARSGAQFGRLRDDEELSTGFYL
jgi:hypothetical protein